MYVFTLCVSACTCMHMHKCIVVSLKCMPQCIQGGQRTTHGSQISPSTMWVPVIELRSSGLAAAPMDSTDSAPMECKFLYLLNPLTGPILVFAFIFQWQWDWLIQLGWWLASERQRCTCVLLLSAGTTRVYMVAHWARIFSIDLGSNLSSNDKCVTKWSTHLPGHKTCLVGLREGNSSFRGWSPSLLMRAHFFAFPPFFQGTPSYLSLNFIYLSTDSTKCCLWT